MSKYVKPKVQRRLDLLKPFFITQELVSARVYRLLGDNALLLFNYEFLKDLVRLRRDLNAPITINNWHKGGIFDGRGYRDNEEETGSEGSTHRGADAFDLDVLGWTAEAVRHHIMKRQNRYPSFRRMENWVRWVHIDCKETGVVGIILFVK